MTDRIRPITTGDIGVAMTGRNRFRVDSASVYSSIVPDEQGHQVHSDPLAGDLRVRRPRAIHPQVLKVPSTRRTRGAKQSRKAKSEEITDLWESMSRNHLSRSLDVNDDSGVHFVNIEDDAPATSTAKKSLRLPQSRAFESREAVEGMSGNIQMVSSTAFHIPELPRGKVLQINVLSTWGDMHYLGLQVSGASLCCCCCAAGAGVLVCAGLGVLFNLVSAVPFRCLLSVASSALLLCADRSLSSLPPLLPSLLLSDPMTLRAHPLTPSSMYRASRSLIPPAIRSCSPTLPLKSGRTRRTSTCCRSTPTTRAPWTTSSMAST